MSRAELASDLGVIAFGAVILEESLRKLPYYVEDVPGPGFLPFWLSLAIIALGVVLTVRAVRAGASSGAEVEWPDAAGWRRIGIAIVALGAGLWLLEAAGFITVAILYMAIVGFALGMRSLRVLVPVSILTAVALFGIFEVLLKVPLPRGVLSFLG